MIRRMSARLAMLLVLLASACAQKSAGQPGRADAPAAGGAAGLVMPREADSQSEQAEERCPAGPMLLRGDKPEGAACKHAEECKPVCCKCKTGVSTWLAATCGDLRCSGRAVTCAETANDAKYCLK
jgi:hypothetical protein